MRKAFIQTVRAELALDSSLAVFLGDISVAGFLGPSDELIRGVYNCGILEQAMVSFAAGCSVGGLYPVVQTIVPFVVERAFEQIKLDFCAQCNAGLIVGVGGGLEYSKLGYTHHTLWDTALLSNLEGLTLFTPTIGAPEVSAMLRYLIRSRKLAYARLTECYLESGYTGAYDFGELIKIKHSANRSTALLLCGAFPGIQTIVDEAAVDVFAYSFPNIVPTNLSMLESYKQVDVWEFGTASILVDLLSKAMPRVVFRGFAQQTRFFRSYGADEARDFIASNWIATR
jgi:Transketolase, pyrimidine binding domain